MIIILFAIGSFMFYCVCLWFFIGCGWVIRHWVRKMREQ